MILGITGAFGCGKSTVRELFAAENWRIFDADGVCHEFYSRRDPGLWSAIQARWGGRFFDNSGNLDRKKVAEAVFNDHTELAALNAIVHPLLKARMTEAVDECRACGVNGAFEVPLLYECGCEALFDAVVTVWTSPSESRRRLYSRGFDDAAIDRRLAMQLSGADKLERADFALINDGDRSFLKKQFDFLLRSFMRNSVIIRRTNG